MILAIAFAFFFIFGMLDALEIEPPEEPWKALVVWGVVAAIIYWLLKR